MHQTCKVSEATHDRSPVAMDDSKGPRAVNHIDVLGAAVRHRNWPRRRSRSVPRAFLKREFSIAEPLVLSSERGNWHGQHGSANLYPQMSCN